MSNSQKTTDRDGKSTSNGVWKDREICFWVHYKKNIATGGKKNTAGFFFVNIRGWHSRNGWDKEETILNFWLEARVWSTFSHASLCASQIFFTSSYFLPNGRLLVLFFCVCVCVCVLLLPINWAFFCLSQCLLASFTGRGNATLPPISVALETRLIISADYMAYLQATWKKNAKLCKNKPFFGYKKACFA